MIAPHHSRKTVGLLIGAPIRLRAPPVRCAPPSCHRCSMLDQGGPVLKGPPVRPREHLIKGPHSPKGPPVRLNGALLGQRAPCLVKARGPLSGHNGPVSGQGDPFLNGPPISPQWPGVRPMGHPFKGSPCLAKGSPVTPQAPSVRPRGSLLGQGGPYYTKGLHCKGPVS